jgi:hypothetical protein
VSRTAKEKLGVSITKGMCTAHLLATTTNAAIDYDLKYRHTVSIFARGMAVMRSAILCEQFSFYYSWFLR